MYLSPNRWKMRKLASVAVLFYCVSLNAQNVGIGTATPQEKLHIDNNIKIGINAWSSAANNRFLKIGDGNNVTIGEAGLDDRLEFSAREFLFKNSGGYPGANGKVGININFSPTAFLEVNGNVKITDGTQDDKKVLTSDATGAASWKFLPAHNSGFNASLESGVLTVADNVETTVVFDAEKFDDISTYNSSNGNFTSPTDGVYLFNVKIQWSLAASTNSELHVLLELNGSLVEESVDYKEATISDQPKTISFGSTLKLNQGDVLKVRVRQVSGTSQIISTTNTSFSGHRVY